MDKEYFTMIFQNNTNLPRNYLARAMECSGAVGRIVIKQADSGIVGYATGFMMSPDLVITCNHILQSVDTASRAELWLDYFVQVDSFSA